VQTPPLLIFGSDFKLRRPPLKFFDESPGVSAEYEASKVSAGFSRPKRANVSRADVISGQSGETLKERRAYGNE
jgi:hypothetical protein